VVGKIFKSRQVRYQVLRGRDAGARGQGQMPFFIFFLSTFTKKNSFSLRVRKLKKTKRNKTKKK